MENTKSHKKMKTEDENRRYKLDQTVGGEV